MTMTNLDTKVVPMRPVHAGRPLDPRLEELRKILRESDVVLADGDLSDAIVVSDEAKFRQRFGHRFDWGRRHREALIRLKQEKDLTDAEIKLFRHTGNLRRTAHGVRLDASPWVAMWGGMQMLCLGTLLSVTVLAGWHNLLFAPLRYLEAWLTLLGIATLCCLLYWSQIKPWLVHRRLQS